MDRFESMAILVTVAEAGSLSAASRQLGTPLATVSRKISQLEGHLGTKLLNRSSRRLALTDTGRSYVEACRRILEEVGEAERAASGEYRAPKGELIIAAPIVFGRLQLLPVVMEFLESFPQIDIRITLSDRVVNLLEERVDVALRIGELPDSSLVATRVGTIRRVVCANPEYFAKRGMPERPDELGAHDCVTFEALMSPQEWVFGSGKSAVSVPIHSRLVVNTAEAAIDAAIAGLGITRVLSYQVAESVRAGKLTLALQGFEPRPWPVNLVYTDRRLLPIKVRAFLDFAAPRLEGRLAPPLP
jgi:DNA-binding transcriptional LysR family regulator